MRAVPKVRQSFWGWLFYYILPLRRKIILQNLRQVYGEKADASAIRRLAQAFYAHIVYFIFENSVMGWLKPSDIKRSVRVEGVDIVLEQAKKNKGLLFLTGHFGNWEWAPIGGVMQFEQFKGKFHVLRRTLVNKRVEKILFNRFYKAGLNVIPKRNSLDHVLTALSKNEVVTFIMDQYANPAKDGILVDFFGKKAGTFKSLAMIARESQAPVIPVRCYRESFGKHVMKFYPPVSWTEHSDSETEIYDNTSAYNRALEGMILESPNQWLWAHKRWKVKPVC